MTVGPADVGVIVPARHAAGTLARAVESALAEGVGAVVIAVDPADEVTVRAAAGLAAAYPSVSVVDNPGGATPTGLNAGIAALPHRVVARLDAHATFGPGYVRAALTALEAGAAVVGGLQRSVGASPVGRATAAAMGTWLGSGGARHRTGAASGPSETAYLGVFDRAWLDRVGGYDPSLARNQDYEICHRIQQAGGLVWFTPDMEATHEPRDSWVDLAVQYHDFGRWKRHVMATAPGSIQPRQLAAPALVLGLIGSVVLVGRRPWLASVVPSAWLLAVAATATTADPAAGDPAEGDPPTPGDRARIGAALAVMHLAWGAGFWRGGRGGDRRSAGRLSARCGS